jgi:hypothetical protein
MPTNNQARLEWMKQAVNDELFLADLNATMEDFKDSDLSASLSIVMKVPFRGN